MKLAVLGAGAWGTALAMAAAPRHDTLLWARSAAQVADMAQERCNVRYLPGLPLPAELHLSDDFDAALAHANGGLLVLATPMAALRDMLQRLQAFDHFQWPLPVLWLCKGFEASSGMLAHEIAGETLGRQGAFGILSGPSFALEVARGQPTALVVAANSETLAQQAVTVFHGDALRVYRSDDIVGVEVGGAVKNVLAIAVGILDGMAPQPGAWALSPGLNARAALITRGLAEMTRLGLAMGARVDTFMGLSGLGDLVLTATGDLSRNRRVGLRLASGQPLAQVLAELGHVAEGVLSAAQVLARAQQLGVDMPITQAVVDVLDGSSTPAEALARLMARDARAEI
jgi:glycerol-3-phosphate dehydrogenase (NAD(P)+)